MGIKYDAKLELHTIFWRLGRKKFTKRFDILLNIPGQQYTFGSKYKERREGEEFIICPFPFVQPTHCKITVDHEGNFWIENASETGKTYVNSRPIGKERIQLKFGETFSLGTLPLDKTVKRCDDVDLAVFNFEKISNQTNENKEEIDENPIVSFANNSAKVGGNVLLVRNILRYICVNNLLLFRFVSKTWSSAACQLLKKRTAAKVHSRIWNGETCQNQLSFFHYLQTMKGELVPRSISLKIPGTAVLHENDNIEESGIEEKYEDEVNNFLENRDGFDHLKLTFRDGKITNFTSGLAEFVLQKVSRELASLKLVCDSAICPAKDKLSNGNWEFLKLRRLSVHCNSGSDYQEFARNLLQKTPLLQEFTSSEFWDPVFLQALSELSFPFLNSIELDNVDKDGLAPLQNVTSSLKTLKLSSPERRSDISDECTPIIAKILENQSESLQHLEINFTNGVITFPFFKKLKSLRVKITKQTLFQFPPFGHAVYDTHFPALESLKICVLSTEFLRNKLYRRLPDKPTLCQFLEQYKPIFAGFFNLESHQVCETLKNLVVTYQYRDYCKGNDMNVQGVREIAAMFPNVNSRGDSGSENCADHSDSMSDNSE